MSWASSKGSKDSLNPQEGESGFDSPSMQQINLTESVSRSETSKPSARFEDGLPDAPCTPSIQVGSRVRLLQDADLDESDIESPSTTRETSSIGTRSTKARQIGTVDQVSRMQMESIYRFLNPSSQAVARKMKSDLPAQPSPSVIGSIRGRKRTMPRMKLSSQTITKVDVETAIEKMQGKYGFQIDNARNILDYILFLLDSRTSRIGDTDKAIISLHADYVGGDTSNYKTWYFNTFAKAELQKDIKNAKQSVAELEMEGMSPEEAIEEVYQEAWRKKMRSLGARKMLEQLALWLLIWGESANLRFAPELLCFIFKLALDYRGTKERPPGWFLDNVIQSTYNFYHSEVKKLSQRRDAGSVVGYDDINEYFRSADKIRELETISGLRLWAEAPERRLDLFGQINFPKHMRKTFYETRTWFHMVVNYNRVIVLHLVTFFWYLVIATPFLFGITENPEQSPPFPVALGMFGIMTLTGHGVAALGTLGELAFFPLSSALLRRMLVRILAILIMATLVFMPSYFAVTSFVAGQEVAPGSYVLALLGAAAAFISTIWLVCIPAGTIGLKVGWTRSKQDEANAPFMFNFPSLPWESRAVSLSFWIVTYAIKFMASFYYVALVQAKPMESLWLYAKHCESATGASPLCSVFGWVTVGTFVLLLFCLHFLDTYIWYTLSITACGFWVNLRRGVTLWAPWREAFSRLPKRIFANLVASSYFTDSDGEAAGIRNRSLACAEIWNSIIISMYNNHLLSPKEMTKLLYEVSHTGGTKSTVEVNEPRYFIAQEDAGAQTAGLWGSSDGYQPEVSRRLSFFAHSIAMAMPEPAPVQNMPTFTVLVPHYGERMLLTLSELIKVSDTTSDITLLEYLKFLYPKEWENFVQETQLLESDEDVALAEGLVREGREDRRLESDMMKAVGFKRVDPKYVMRTRIWASLRTQTLYRTIDGFFNYYKALKVLYRAESVDVNVDDEDFESDAHAMASRKFRFLVAMQRYQKFTAEEKEAVNTLFEIFPDIQIAYIEEGRDEHGMVQYFSALVDGHCPLNDKGMRVPRFRVRLPGWPILGDGKSDNQNHAVIFSRGEFLQVIDANQEHYIEECFKIRNLLGEFEYSKHSHENPYVSSRLRPNALNRQDEFNQAPVQGPVAIVGTREHVFSNGVGVMADVMAGKEFVFGTLIQRMLSILGGRLHYGHPDFLNAVWILPRGGVSKAQKSLNLNEDIFAGMNSFMRGGRVKYTEYVQCGKGRDLGFSSVVNFLSKLSLGVGEQSLTREHYIFGTKLSIDRLFTFFFGHIGFFIQNAAAIIGLSLYAMVALAATTLDSHTLAKCAEEDIPGPYCSLVEQWKPEEISAWLTNAFIGVIVAMILSQLPLFLQLLTEIGLTDAITRIFSQLISFSPVIEAFATATYAQTFIENLKYGGAAYIATGRSVATSRASFRSLYARFSGAGVQLGLALLSVTIALIVNGITVELGFPIFSLLFGIFGLGLTIAPWLFNFHQFDLNEYLLDYPETLDFLFSGHGVANSKPTWSQMIWQRRKTKTTRPDRWDWMSYIRVNWIENVGFSAFMTLFYALIYTFSLRTGEEDVLRILREMGVVSSLITGFNFTICLIFGVFALVTALILKAGSATKESIGQALALVGYSLSFVGFLAMTYMFWLVDGVQFLNTMFAVRALVEIQKLQYNILCALLPADMPKMVAHIAFWSGDWTDAGYWRFIPELLFKTHEMFFFGVDLILVHLLLLMLLPFCIVPVFDHIHAFMILWVRPRFMTWNRKLKKNAVPRQKRPIWPATLQFGAFCIVFVGLITVFALPATMASAFAPLVAVITSFFKSI